ncbi:MAG: hypothetical protein FJX76_05105 [Armatimonadetes bacterium]|nr:hypothetical protein [Armatimonadota bacterium]
MNPLQVQESLIERATQPVIAPAYPNHALPDAETDGRCRDLPAAWRALLEPLYGEEGFVRVRHITTGGSDRAFYRVYTPDRSHVVCVTPNRAEFQNYVAIGHFLRGHGLPLPEIISWSDTTGLAVLQDAGSLPLQEVLLNNGARSEVTLDAYRSVLSTLGELQAVDSGACDEMNSRPFGLTDLRWETEYFRGNFLGRHLGWDLSADEFLTSEFETLARRVLEEPLYPMHRDFQSQNVFIMSGNVWLLDFQGARQGPLHYDVASLLRDPYVCLPADVEDDLLRFYHASAMPQGTPYADWDVFRYTYSTVSMQRLMQALGAYGFLSLVKGKVWFRRWITPALELLSRALQEVYGFPRLKEVVAEARGRHEALGLEA